MRHLTWALEEECGFNRQKNGKCSKAKGIQEKHHGDDKAVRWKGNRLS